MADVTFEEEVQAWAAFCKRDGIGAVPPLRAEVEVHMKQRYTRAIDGQPISQEELDLIFDYTCDTCELYIKTELLGRQGWDLRVAEAFLTGKHPTMNKIRYCAETITTSILNLKFETQFDSLSRPTSSGVPNLAHLMSTNTNNALFSTMPQSLSTSSLPVFISPLVSAGSSPAVQFSPSLSAKSSPLLTTTSNSQVSRSISSVPTAPTCSITPVAPVAHHVHISSHPPKPQLISHDTSTPPHPSQSSPSLIRPNLHSSTPILITTSNSNLSRADSAPNPSTSGPKDHHKSHSHSLEPSRGLVSMRSDSVVSGPKSSLSMPLMTVGAAKPSASRSDLVDGVALKKQPCAKLPIVGFCSPRDCDKAHSPSFTMCKWLTMNGICEERNCVFQHPNLITRELTMKPIREGTLTQRALSLAEWNTLKLTMVFHCHIPMRPKKCGKGAECIIVNCPKQHKKPPKPIISVSTPAASSSSSSSVSNAASVTLVASSSPSGKTKDSKSARKNSTTIAVITPSTSAHSHSSQASIAPPLPPKPTLTLKDVTKQQNHINLVLSIMQGGCVNSKPLKILKLEEITNPSLDEQYQAYFRKTQEVKQLRPSEIYGFHGAPTAAIQSIAANGFDMSKIKRTKFGHGLYCALDPNVSVEYCGDGAKMLLVRLITDGLRWVKDPAYYVIHDSASVNPLYIITFEKS